MPTEGTILDITTEEMEVCLSVLQRIADSRGTIPRSDRFNGLVSKIYREGKKFDKQEARRKLEREDRAVKAQTAMVQIQRDAVAPHLAALPAPTAPARILNEPETCYICKKEFTEVHFFYHLLCPSCAAYNFQMRDVHSDLTGRTALHLPLRFASGPPA